MPIFSLFNVILEVLETAVRQEKEIKEIHIKKEVKLPIFADDMKIIKTQKFLAIINKYSKLVEYQFKKNLFFYIQIII